MLFFIYLFISEGISNNYSLKNICLLGHIELCPFIENESRIY